VTVRLPICYPACPAAGGQGILSEMEMAKAGGKTTGKGLREDPLSYFGNRE
jgi:hypothetical protein